MTLVIAMHRDRKTLRIQGTLCTSEVANGARAYTFETTQPTFVSCESQRHEPEAASRSARVIKFGSPRGISGTKVTGNGTMAGPLRPSSSSFESGAGDLHSALVFTH
ncbi:hypothetical protein [Falsiruegeria litorea]|uniref:hypothetical protein n=1 Tax=Falsiruegeria litorea TaxID=1280831 RepID=UPI0013FE1F16|nr:hypothetical protein [Falsiruegeria litorea]